MTNAANKASTKAKTVVANKEVIAPNEVGTVASVLGAEVIATDVATSKAKIAKGIFSEMFAVQPVPARKDMIARAVAEAGLTPQGAATYLQNFKKANNLVRPRVAVVPAA